MKPRKGDYGDVPPPYTTIQVPLEQINTSEVQYQETEIQQQIQVLENVEYVPTQIIQTESIQLPSYEVHTLQDISYSSGLQNSGEDQIILQPLLQPNISFAFWTPTTFNTIGSGTTTTQM